MSVHPKVARATQIQIHDRMFGEERQHVVEKRHARFDQRLPASVNVQLDEYAGLVGNALHLGVALFHACRLNRPFGGKQTENPRMPMKYRMSSRIRAPAPFGVSLFTDSVLPDNARRQSPPRSPFPRPSRLGGKPCPNNRPPQIRQARWFPCR